MEETSDTWVIDVLVEQMKLAQAEKDQSGVRVVMEVFRAIRNKTPTNKKNQHIITAIHEGLAKCGIPSSAISPQLNDPYSADD